ncbi:MAG: serpin family protein [Bacteroidales bacterium]|nr:serpin family protein [Bacteroidales bacterium]
MKAGNEFSFDLFQNIYISDKKSDNIMVSPLSVSLALAMTYNGAAGKTKSDMEKTLRVYGLSPEDINSSYHDLAEALKELDEKVFLRIANAIYYRENFEVEKSFIATNKQYYRADVAPLDFGSDEAVDIINKWVYEHTNGKIEKIIDEITPLHIMFLLNAIYFKGTWQQEFNEKSTGLQQFYPEPGISIDCETMQRLDTLAYMSNDIFSAIILPYGKGNFNMTLFLPEPEKDLQEIIDRLNKENWKKWMDSFKITESVDIKLPKFKYEYEIMLNDVLTEMGMGIAFTGQADFTGINRLGDMLIDYVKHKSFIEVNEEGTEAAAVTVVAIERLSVGGPAKIPFYVNRPFMYVITEKSTDAILFIGTVKNPNSN